MTSLATLLALHGGHGRMEPSYFWRAILIVLLAMAVFGTLSFLLVRAYRREQRDERAHG